MRFSPVAHTTQLVHNDTPQAIDVNLALFAPDTWFYATERKEAYILRKL
jgi:hypothetical protein